MRDDNFLDHGQTEPGAIYLPRRKRGEDPLPLRVLDAGSVVEDPNRREVPGASQLDTDGAFLRLGRRYRFDRIDDEVRDRLAKW